MRIFPKATLASIAFAVLRIIFVAYAAFGTLLYVKQDSMLLFPDQTPLEECDAFADAEIVDMGGTRGYYSPLGTSSALAVVYHGNAGRACDRAYYRSVLSSAGYAALFVEYTGYAGDKRTPSIEELLGDARRVHAWVSERHPDVLAILGESLGSGPASYHATLARPEKLVLVTPFDTLGYAVSEHYPLYPVSLFLRTDMENTTWASSASTTLIIHGTADKIIPYRRACALYRALSAERSMFLPLEGLDHNSVFGNGRALLAIRAFLMSEIPLGISQTAC